jgi:hypothetical protein
MPTEPPRSASSSEYKRYSIDQQKYNKQLLPQPDGGGNLEQNMIIDIVPTLHLHTYSTLASLQLTIRTSNLHSPEQKLLLRSSPPKRVRFAPTTTDVCAIS